MNLCPQRIKSVPTIKPVIDWIAFKLPKRMAAPWLKYWYGCDFIWVPTDESLANSGSVIIPDEDHG